MSDPIVEAIHKYREQYAARFHYDLAAMCRDLRVRQAGSGHEVVSRPPRKVQVEQKSARRAGYPTA